MEHLEFRRRFEGNIFGSYYVGAPAAPGLGDNVHIGLFRDQSIALSWQRIRDCCVLAVDFDALNRRF